VNADIASGAAIALSKLATDPLARANHTGTQAASTISDLATVVQGYSLSTFSALTGDLSANSYKITNLANPVNAQDAANKAYVDSVSAGLDPKASVRAATTANITLSGAQTIDGVSIIAGDRVLVKDQSTGAENGIYVCASGAWTRADDADSSAEVTGGMFCFVAEGTANGDTGWVLVTNDTITLGSTSLVFSQFAGAGSLTGTSNRITVSAGVIDISAAYVGQTSITTLGTITTGVWTGTPIAIANGGTGSTSASTARTALGATGKYSVAVGDGSSTSYTITHNLGSRDACASVRLTLSPYTEYIADISYTTVNTITVDFAVAPTTNLYTVTVIA
jgi:hypothetical protein